ncbi:hypothetical protein CHY_2311 [Carboxydothermus hydrogenoformans Z-2901]|uniref:Uncharacterized protein n=1 Tax=Carboxydothermus hydrogenoformans (strain ATCC BAA-161 / DSM 6008 / Z-2901) TaxID=246194 RepID=Q3A9R4_CARHZ|nr:hypothetical protein CHY_2311 [Carboxydothermus hydrogenoformans Z-2901]
MLPRSKSNKASPGKKQEAGEFIPLPPVFYVKGK